LASRKKISEGILKGIAKGAREPIARASVQNAEIGHGRPKGKSLKLVETRAGESVDGTNALLLSAM